MTRSLSLVLLALAAGSAAAQPPAPEPVGGMPADPPATPPPVTTTPAEPPHPPRPEDAGPKQEAEAPTTGRPEGIAFGIGVGYTFPTMGNLPNTTSVRMRLASGLTFEPIVVLGNETSKQDPGSSKDSTTQLSIAALARIPVVRHGKVELEILAGAGFGTRKTNPDGADNNTTTSNLGFSWGLAVSYWINRHWNLTFSARNDLLSIVKSTREMAAGDVESSTTTIQAEFAPVVSAMIHLYN